MRAISEDDLRRDLVGALDAIAAGGGPLLVTRGRGEPAAVLLSPADFAAHAETRHLLGSARNAAHLLEAAAELDRGGGRERVLVA